MDISLNITTAPQPIRSKPTVEKTKTKNAVKKKGMKNQSASFKFDFGGGNQKIKAIVAKKRPIKQTNSLAAPNVTLQKAEKESGRCATPKEKNPERIVPKSLKDSTHQEEGTSFNEDFSRKKEPASDSLLLNICTEPPKSNAPFQPKANLSRNERFRKKMEMRKERKQNSKRVLSEEELKEGLRRYSENPNKKPRIADEFFAKEKEQQRKLNEEKEEADFGDINPLARKANAFRVKRPEDSSVKAINLFKDNPEAREIGQRFVKPIPEKIFDGTKVESLNLHPHAVKNLKDFLDITELTTVQKKTIPKALEGRDILVRSQTGSGKTLAYALPVVEKLQAIRPKITRDDGILAIIIVPSRELATQTYELLVKLLKPFTWIVPGVLMGGERRKAEKARLRKGINILTGTPGRLVDHLLHTSTFKLNKAQFLILDEADRLLEMGYEQDVKQIVEAIDKHRSESNEGKASPLQRMLLSATLTAAVQKLAGLTLSKPVYIDNSEEDPSTVIRNTNGYSKDSIGALQASAISPDLNDEETGILTIPDNLQLNFVVTPAKLRLVTLCGLLVKEYIGKPKLKAIVFMSTMEIVNYHHSLLNEALTQKILDEDDEDKIQDMLAPVKSKRKKKDESKESESDKDDDGDEPLLKGLRFFKLQGSMSQTDRQGVFKSFRECESGVLLATDVVGRGIDVPEIDIVIQYSPPQKIADFVHRVGRTARAGRSGRAVLFLTPSETQFIRHLEEKRIRISQSDMDIYLKALLKADDEARTVQEAASNLQHKFQELVDDDREMHEAGCKAFVSWVKFYSTFPKELKPIFNIKNAHMGHFAKSFALKDAPKSFVRKYTGPKPMNHSKHTERDRDTDKRGKQKRFSTTVTNEVRNARRPMTAGMGKGVGAAPRSSGGANGFTNGPNRLVRMLPNSLALTTSEFDSGLSTLKSKNKKK